MKTSIRLIQYYWIKRIEWSYILNLYGIVLLIVIKNHIKLYNKGVKDLLPLDIAILLVVFIQF